MKKDTLGYKIAILMFIAVMIVIATGFLSYRSLSSIVLSINVQTNPDLELVTLKSISHELEKAENSIRTYTYTLEESELQPFYNLINSIDEQINLLKNESKGDDRQYRQIDTLKSILGQKLIIWDEMLMIYNDSRVEKSFEKLVADLARDSVKEEKKILNRFLIKREINKYNKKDIIEKVKKIDARYKILDSELRNIETELAYRSGQLNERFYIIIEDIETSKRKQAQKRAAEAEYLARKTYKWISLFALAATLLAAAVIIIILKYLRKTWSYQVALLESKNETENLARTKELFMANMSHEIRTPLNAISGFLEQVITRDHDNETAHNLQIIKSSTDHLNRIVDDILDFSKLQAGKLVLEQKHFRIEKILEDIYALFKPRADQNNTKLVYNKGKTAFPVLFGDPHRLQQIIFNLLGNAVKFTRDGKIAYSAKILEEKNARLKISIRVEDTGIGIEEEKLQTIFEDFTQAGMDISRKYGGTGLGLSIVKKLVELHDGNINVESKLNKGTIFNCTLFFEKGDELLIETANYSRKETFEKINGFNVLIVDDEDYNRLLLKKILDKRNIKYKEAVNGMEAIELVKYTRFDMIMMDIRMPVLDGIKTTKFIRGNFDDYGKALPIIAVTAACSSADKEKYLKNGMTDVLQKPFSEKLLYSMINNIISSKKITNNSETITTVEADKNNKKIDLTGLYHLADNDEVFIKEMLQKFVESTEDGLLQMNTYIKKKDLHSISEIAHKLSSPCRHIGANKLLDYLKQTEEQSKNKINLKIIQETMGKANAEFQGVKEEIYKHIEKLNNKT